MKDGASVFRRAKKIPSTANRHLVPTFAEIENNPAVEFPKGNKIPYRMDSQNWEGIPSDRYFYIEDNRREGWVTLRARGYGIHGDYGKGYISVKQCNLPPEVDYE